MGRSRFSLFKSRFVVKMPRSHAEVAWHQDVGDRNGGFTPDGKAVPTLAVWMGIDAIAPDNGGLEVIPGSHQRLLGDYNKQIKSGLLDSGALTQVRPRPCDARAVGSRENSLSTMAGCCMGAARTHRRAGAPG